MGSNRVFSDKVLYFIVQHGKYVDVTQLAYFKNILNNFLIDFIDLYLGYYDVSIHTETHEKSTIIELSYNQLTERINYNLQSIGYEFLDSVILINLNLMLEQIEETVPLVKKMSFAILN